MSRSSSAKRARRRKRVGARNESWLPPDVHADVKLVGRIADVIIPRGWEFDGEYSTDEFLTWFFPPSGIEVPDELDGTVEPVTRIWLTDPESPHVIYVGAGKGARDVALTVDELFERLDEIEGHRAQA